MIRLILLCLLLGSAWALVGVIMSRVAAKEMSIANFYFVGSALLTPLTFFICVDWTYLLAKGLCHDMILSSALVFGLGLFTAIGQTCVVGAMRSGLHAPAYALGQSAVIFPFIFTALLGWEQRGVPEWCGLAVIVFGVCFIAHAYPRSALETGVSLVKRGTYSFQSILIALAGMCFLGIGQVLGLLPSLWLSSPDPAGLRLPILMLSMALSYWLIGRIKARPFLSGNPWLALSWSLVAGASYVLLFYTLDYGASYNVAGLVFPLAIGSNILFFTFATRYFRQEKMPRKMQVGVLGIVVGLLLIVTSVLFSIE